MDGHHTATDGFGSSDPQLLTLIAERSRRRDGISPSVRLLADHLTVALRDRFAHQVAAILLYGSGLRGAEDTLLDAYLLVDDWAALPGSWFLRQLHRWLPPAVVYVELALPDAAVGRAKVAILPMRAFRRHIERDRHPYFWARFAQPCHLQYCRDAAVETALLHTLAHAVERFESAARSAAGDADGAQRYLAGLQASYGCELRAERPHKVRRIWAANRDYYQALSERSGAGAIPPQPGWHWRLRRVLGKPLSAARLLKAALTFEGGLDYLLWKVARHSGVTLQATERQRRHPLIFAWPLLWRLYRQGGFR